MVRPKDPFWKYAKDLKNHRFSCNFCHNHFPGGISRIKWHLSGVTGKDIKVCEQVPPHIQLEVRKVLDTPNKIKVDRSSQVKGQNNNNVRDLGDNDLSTPASSSSAPNACNEQLAKLCFVFGIHPKAVVSPIFEDFVKSIAEYGPGYQLPSPSTLEDQLMVDVGTKADEYVENFINDSLIDHQVGCTLMIVQACKEDDFIEDNSYTDFFACSQGGVVCLNSWKDLSRNGIQEAISSTIHKLLGTSDTNFNELGPRNVVQVLIYNDYNDGDFSKIRNMVLENHPRICVNRCAAFVIDDVFRKMQCWQELHSIVGIVRLILSYTYHHSNVSFRRGMKIPKGHVAGIVFMLKSVLEVEDELQAVPFSIVTLSRDRLDLLDEQKVVEHLRCARFVDYIICCKEFWSRVKAAEQVLFLLFQTQCLVNEDSSIGYLYEMIERVSDGIDKIRNYDRSLYDLAMEEFIDMRRKIIHPIHAAAAFLNPTYMCSDNFKENAEMTEGINYVFENMVESEEKETFTKEVQQYRTKMLFTAQAMTKLKTCHPQMWWDNCGKHTPVLRKYAIRILSQPCSTSICKHYRVPLGDWRSEDNEDRSTKLNTIIMSRNNYSPSLGLELIILDKLGGEDHDAFKDVEERVDEYYMRLLPEFTDDTLVDRLIEDQRFSWLDNFPYFLFSFGDAFWRKTYSKNICSFQT